MVLFWRINTLLVERFKVIGVASPILIVPLLQIQTSHLAMVLFWRINTLLVEQFKVIGVASPVLIVPLLQIQTSHLAMATAFLFPSQI
jgi:hypothetical protein